MTRKVFLFAATFAALPVFGQQQEWRIDTGHSSANFSVRHMMVSNVRGQLGKVTGTVKYDPANVAKSVIDATIDVNGIDTRNEKRDAHLRSADFFDATQFPNMTFKSTAVEQAGAGKLKVTGNLTIKNVTKPVVLMVEGPTAPMKDPRGGARAGASATTTINRKDFGITWSRPIETGGVVVGDEVAITIDVALVLPPPGAAKPAN